MCSIAAAIPNGFEGHSNKEGSGVFGVRANGVGSERVFHIRHERALREGVEDEIASVEKIIHTQRRGPVIRGAEVDAGVGGEPGGEALVGVRVYVGVIERSPELVAVAASGGERPAIVRAVGDDEIRAPLRDVGELFADRGTGGGGGARPSTREATR